MSGRSFWTALLLALTALLLAIAGLGCGSRDEDHSREGDRSVSRRRPSFLFLLTDDQRFDELGAAGNRLIHTPHLDSLAAEGVMFENAFATTAICAVSRASILTGQHMARHGVRNFHTPLTEPALDSSYPIILRRAGYRTGYLGKYAIGEPKLNERLALPSNRFDFWYGFPQRVDFFQEVDGVRRHLTGLLADRAIEFLRSQPDDQPFSLSIGFKSPHGGQVDPGTKNLYAEMDVPLSPTFSKEAFASQPNFIQRSRSAGRKRVRILREDPTGFADIIRTRYQLISGVDAAVGRILAALEELGRASDTVVILTSDHGQMLGDHGLFGKWLMYESSIRVPLIVRDPRTSSELRGRRRDEMVLNIDVAPTLLGLAGLAIPAGMQGRDLGPLLAGESEPWREEWYYEHTFTPASSRQIAASEGVRTASWKYIRYPKENPIFEQLFDLAADPEESVNLVGLEQYGERLTKMRSRWERLRREAR